MTDDASVLGSLHPVDGEGEPPGEGDEDHTQNLAALIRRARNEAEATAVVTRA
jgi:hypothetical protein